MVTSTKASYPYNLLIAVKGKSYRELPRNITKDILAGVEYALSLLDSDEQWLLNLRYREALSQQEVGERLSLSPEQVCQAEVNTLKKLRAPAKWNYMVHGITGYCKLYAEDKYYIGYNKGYAAGYQDGENNGRSGTRRAGSILEQPIESLQLPTRLYNALMYANFRHIGDLVKLDKYDIWAIKGVSKNSADKIAKALMDCGISQSAWNDFLL